MSASKLRILFFGFVGLMIVGIGSAVTMGFAASDEKDEAFAPAPYIPDGTRNQNPSEGKLKGITLRAKRSLLMVKDLKRSLEFYENVIGLEVYAVDQVYSLDQTTIGNKIFNTPYGTRRRIAQLNTSSETRGLALREIDAEFEIPQTPRLFTILYEASDILGIRDRAEAAGATIIGPHVAIVPEREGVPELRYMEMAILDPDGHVITFFKYYTDSAEDEAEWQTATEKYQLDVEL